MQLNLHIHGNLRSNRMRSCRSLRGGIANHPRRFAAPAVGADWTAEVSSRLKRVHFIRDEVWTIVVLEIVDRVTVLKDDATSSGCDTHPAPGDSSI